MSTAPKKLWDIYEGLKNQFLFHNDINSIYILLALYDLEENISNIRPKYTCTKSIKRRIKYILKNRTNRELIARNISILIHEDINRLELCFYLEGYKYGYNNKKWVDRLEKKAIEIYGLEGLYNNNYLFHYDFSNLDVIELRRALRREIDSKEKKDRQIEGLVYTFCNKIIKKKIKDLDKYVDKQLMIDFNPYNYSIKEEDYKLKEEEQDKIYHSIVSIIIKNVKDIYKDASWYAINDRVLKRYI